MRKLLLAMAVCLCGTVAATDVVLDLSNIYGVSYDANGVWSDVYTSDPLFTDNFMFSHAGGYDATYEYYYFSGFFPSKVSTIQETATMADQWGCMAKGGVAGEGTPFLGAHWNSSETSSNRSCMINNGSYYYASGFYVCNSAYTYYSMQKGDAYAKKFEQGDWLKLVVHGFTPYQTEVIPVEVYLADYRSENPEDWKMINSWEWVDLSSMGMTSSLYFTMESSDTGDFGMNTPAYFCMDKLTMSTTPVSAVEEVEVKTTAYYNRAADQLQVEAGQAVEVALYAVNGTELVRATVEGSATWDMSQYPAGVYVVRCGNHTVKIIK